MHTLSDLQHAAAELRDTVSNLVSHLVNHPNPIGPASAETVDTIHAEIELSTKSIAQVHNTLVGAAVPAGGETLSAEPAPAPLPAADPVPAPTQPDSASASADDSQSTADALNQEELDRLADEQAATGPA